MNIINHLYTFSFLCFFVVLMGSSDAFSKKNSPQIHLQQFCRRYFHNNNYCCDINANIILSMSEEQDPQQETTYFPPKDNNNKDDETLEVKTLKERITELESTLLEKKSSLQYILEQCEEYSKSGYARKVAEMENMKRVRSNIASTSQSSATAAVLRDFLPVYDTLNNLKEFYANDEFGCKYSELNLQQTFQILGVTPYNVVPGEEVNNFRMKVLENEISTEQPKGSVLREVSTGLELDGNVIRPASCITSSGSDNEDENEEHCNDETAD